MIGWIYYISGIPIRTVHRIISDKDANPTTTFESPQKRYDQSRQRILVDDFDRDAMDSS